MGIAEKIVDGSFASRDKSQLPLMWEEVGRLLDEEKLKVQHVNAHVKHDGFYWMDKKPLVEARILNMEKSGNNVLLKRFEHIQSNAAIHSSCNKFSVESSQ